MRGFSAERASLNGGTGGSARRSRRVAASDFWGAGVAVGATGASVVALAGGAVTAKGAIAGAGSAGGRAIIPPGRGANGDGRWRGARAPHLRHSRVRQPPHTPRPPATRARAP